MKREYILKFWRNGRWEEVARAASPYGFDVPSAEHETGDGWTVDCICGAHSVFHGCGSHAHDGPGNGAEGEKK